MDGGMLRCQFPTKPTNKTHQNTWKEAEESVARGWWWQIWVVWMWKLLFVMTWERWQLHNGLPTTSVPQIQESQNATKRRKVHHQQTHDEQQNIPCPSTKYPYDYSYITEVCSSICTGVVAVLIYFDTWRVREFGFELLGGHGIRLP